MSEIKKKCLKTNHWFQTEIHRNTFKNNKKVGNGWKKYFDQLLAARSTQKLVEIHNRPQYKSNERNKTSAEKVVLITKGTTSVDRSTFARTPFGRGRLWLDSDFGSIRLHSLDFSRLACYCNKRKIFIIKQTHWISH